MQWISCLIDFGRKLTPDFYRGGLVPSTPDLELSYPNHYDSSLNIRVEFKNQSLKKQLFSIIGQDVEDEAKIYPIDRISIDLKGSIFETFIFDHEVLAKYELIFRFLLTLADLSENLDSKTSYSSLNHRLKSRFMIFRQKLLSFLRHFRQYLSYDVIEPLWQSLEHNFSSVGSIHEQYQTHEKFIDSILRRATLTNPKLLLSIFSIFSTCRSTIDLCQGSGSSISEQHLSHLDSSFTNSVNCLIDSLSYFSSRDYDHHLTRLLSRLRADNLKCYV